MKSIPKPLYIIMVLAMLFGMLGIQPARPVQAANDIRISQVYGGGGNSGATLKNDFIELFNAGPTAVSLTDWSVQYASATGTTWQMTVLSGTIQPGQYYLIQQAAGSGGTVDLPTPDATGTISMSGTAGKVALVNSTTNLAGGCPTGETIVDFVGFGSTANCYEGSGPTPAPSNTTSVIRKNGGCVDTDNNSSDFITSTPTPRNSSSSTHSCTAPYVTNTLPTNNMFNVAVDSTITINFSELVTVEENWFSISCNLSGVHSASMTNANPEFTLTPDTNFLRGDTCTVTVVAAKVNDQGDPVEVMEADHVFRFTTVEACSDPYTPIYDIQGTDETSPLADTLLATEGVVVGDFQSGGKNGYYIQDSLGDDDPATSDGIFIYNTSTPVNVGEHVRVRGTAVEYNGLTEISPVAQVWVCSPDNTIDPLELTLPFDSTDHEHLEGMLVTFPQALVISEYFNFDRYGELLLTSKRHSTPTAVVEPGAAAIAMAAAHELDSIAIDDGSTYQNPSILRHPDGSAFGLDNYFRGGDTVEGLTGVMDYNFGAWTIQPVGTATYEAVNMRTEAPDLVEGEIRVASLNVLNYFITKDDSGDICSPSGDMNCRGADTALELERQQVKIVNAILGMDADIVGLIEIENEHPLMENDAPVATLVTALNEAVGENIYAYIATGPIGTDAIKQAFLYKTEKVVAVGEHAILDSTVDPDFIDDLNRPSLAQSFEDKITGEIFTVSVNHLKSKGSACVDDPDLGDGQGNCNLTRLAAAEALVDWLETDPTETGSDMYVIIGDLNSYAMEDPIDAIKEGADGVVGTDDDLYNLVEHFNGDDAYGYVFDGQTGYLDHALANKKFSSYVLDADFWHINADEADVFDYDMSFKPEDVDDMFDSTTPYRSSDHDPVLISLLLNHGPMAVDDEYTIYRLGELVVNTPGVLENDSDVNIYDNIWASLIPGSGPNHGSLLFNPDGSFTYTPDGDFVGEDIFQYLILATPGLMSEYADYATVRITVTDHKTVIFLPLIFR